MTIQATRGEELLRAHIARMNAAAETGDYDPMVDALAEDAVLEFTNKPIPAVKGREAMRRAYREMPIGEGVDVLEVSEPAEDVVEARFQWQKTRGLGTMTLHHTDGVVDHITVAFEPIPSPPITAI